LPPPEEMVPDGFLLIEAACLIASTVTAPPPVMVQSNLRHGRESEDLSGISHLAEVELIQ